MPSLFLYFGVEKRVSRYLRTYNLCQRRLKNLNSLNDVHFITCQVALVVKNLPANAGDLRDASLIPSSGRSPGGGDDNPLQYSCLESPVDRGAWREGVCMVHGVAKSWI